MGTEKPGTARRPVSAAGARRVPAPRRPLPADLRGYVLVRKGRGAEQRLLLYPPQRAPRSLRRRRRTRRIRARLRFRLPHRARLAVAVTALGAVLFAGSFGTPVLTDVRALLTGGSGQEQAAAVTPAPNAAAAQASVDAAVGRLLAQRPKDAISLAALDTTTHVQVGSHGDVPVTAASVFKLALLEGYLLRDQDRGQAPGTGAASQLTAMIENSDNDAADAVYAALGGSPGVQAALPRLGVTRSALGPAGLWGLSRTTAADQLRLLGNLVSPGSPLSPASRAYALRLMGNVQADQRWGVGAAADPGSDFANKNGWLRVDDDGGRWAVGSVGVVDVGGHQVLLAVLTEHSADQADGIGLVESVSTAVADALRGGGRRAAATK